MIPKALEELLDSGGLAGLGPEARPGRSGLDRIEASMDAIVSAAGMSDRDAACLRGLVLVWHDYLDEAHALVQDLPGGDAAWVHGIVHRREPDYSNARYWFQRVGGHPALEGLAGEAAGVLAGHTAVPYRLIRDGIWDPFAFVEAVSAAVRRGGEGELTTLLRDLQRLEVRVLAAHLTRG